MIFLGWSSKNYSKVLFPQIAGSYRGSILLKGEVFGGGLCGEVWQRCCAGCCAGCCGCCECGGKVWQRCCAVVLRMVVCRLVCRLVFRLRWRGLAKVLCRVLRRPAVRLLSLAEVLCCPGCCTGCGWLLFAAAAKSGKRAVQRAAGWRGLAKAMQQAAGCARELFTEIFKGAAGGTKSGMVVCCAGCCPEKSGKGAVQGAVQAAGQSVVARGTVQGCWVQGAGQCSGELWERGCCVGCCPGVRWRGLAKVLCTLLSRVRWEALSAGYCAGCCPQCTVQAAVHSAKPLHCKGLCWARLTYI